MQRTLDEWFADFQAIMFRGYFAGHEDAAGKYRAMENENAKLKALMRRFMDDVKEVPAKVGNDQEISKNTAPRL